MGDAMRHVILSGCSGGGKSTLLAELGRRGFVTVAEPGRRIVERALRGEGGALPWVDLAAFARAALATSEIDRNALGERAGWIFFDRGLIDAAAALAFASGDDPGTLLRDAPRFHRHVFVTPPWRRIFVSDAARRHGWRDAVAEYDRLVSTYTQLGYAVIELPRVDVRTRADFVLDRLERSNHESIPAQP